MPARDEGLSTTNILSTKRCGTRKTGNGNTRDPQTPAVSTEPANLPPSPPSPTPVRETPEPPAPNKSFHFTDSDEETSTLAPEQPTVTAEKMFAGHKTYPHRLDLDGRPAEGCVADSHHFSGSASLVFTFMVLHSMREGPDGRLESAQLQCCLCAQGGGKKGVYSLTAATKTSTGTMLTHFRTKHEEWWTAKEKLDEQALPSRSARSFQGTP
jgi:hypothetical protein